MIIEKLSLIYCIIKRLKVIFFPFFSFFWLSDFTFVRSNKLALSKV